MPRKTIETLFKIEAKLTERDIEDLFAQFSVDEQIELIFSILSNWEHQTDLDKVAAWIRQA